LALILIFTKKDSQIDKANYIFDNRFKILFKGNKRERLIII